MSQKLSQALREEASKRETAQQFHDYWGTGAAKQQLEGMVGKPLSPEAAQAIAAKMDELHGRTSTVLKREAETYQQAAAQAESLQPKPLPYEAGSPEHEAHVAAYNRKKGVEDGYRKAAQEYQQAMQEMQRGMAQMEAERARHEANGWAQAAVPYLYRRHPQLMLEQAKYKSSKKKVGTQGRNGKGRFAKKDEATVMEKVERPKVDAGDFAMAKRNARQNFVRDYLDSHPELSRAVDKTQEMEQKYGPNVLEALANDCERAISVIDKGTRMTATGIRQAPGLMDKAWDGFWGEVGRNLDPIISFMETAWEWFIAH